MLNSEVDSQNVGCNSLETLSRAEVLVTEWKQSLFALFFINPWRSACSKISERSYKSRHSTVNTKHGQIVRQPWRRWLRILTGSTQVVCRFAYQHLSVSLLLFRRQPLCSLLPSSSQNSWRKTFGLGHYTVTRSSRRSITRHQVFLLSECAEVGQAGVRCIQGDRGASLLRWKEWRDCEVSAAGIAAGTSREEWVLGSTDSTRQHCFWRCLHRQEGYDEHSPGDSGWSLHLEEHREKEGWGFSGSWSHCRAAGYWSKPTFSVFVPDTELYTRLNTSVETASFLWNISTNTKYEPV